MICAVSETVSETESAKAVGGMARRCVRAALMGVALGLVWLGLDRLVSERVVCSGEGWDCFGFAFFVTPVVLLLAAVLAGLVLKAAKVERPWWVALGGPVAFWAIQAFLSAVRFTFFPYVLIVVTAAGAYAVAAVVTAPGYGPRWRLAAAIGVVALLPLSSLVETVRTTNRESDELTAYGHPLLAPDLPGYSAGAAGLIDYESSFYFRLTSTAGAEIQVKQRPLPANFRPPENCAFGSPTPQPCVQVADEVWKISRENYLVYFARRGDQLLDFNPGKGVPEADLLKAATSLRERPSDYFTG
jgi:hypothetical protein